MGRTGSLFGLFCSHEINDCVQHQVEPEHVHFRERSLSTFLHAVHEEDIPLINQRLKLFQLGFCVCRVFCSRTAAGVAGFFLVVIIVSLRLCSRLRVHSRTREVQI